jgi:hypothetical protein
LQALATGLGAVLDQAFAGAIFEAAQQIANHALSGPQWPS